MSEFTKTFLRDRLGDERQPREFFGAFGKHPGWDDHIEDLPLPTASMATAKQLLYVQGIGSQISSGAWTRLDAASCLAGFEHAFLWVRGRQFLVGRMWASRDGKRRAHFPMVAVVQGIDVAFEKASEGLLAQLESVAAHCRVAQSAGEVRAVLSDLVHLAPPAPDESDPADAPRCTLDASRAAVLPFAGEFRDHPSPHIRLPAAGGDVPRSLRFWSRVCTALAPADLPLLFLAPLGEPWIDVLVGEPTPSQFFCLRAAPPAVPIFGGSAPPDSAAELDADELIKSAAGAQAPAGERSWISRLLRH